MNKDWFPFFSMLLWAVGKILGLVMMLAGLQALATMLAVEFRFGQLLLAVLAPIGIGWLLLTTELVFDLATAEMRRRMAK